MTERATIVCGPYGNFSDAQSGCVGANQGVFRSQWHALAKKHNAESRPHSRSRRAAAQSFLDCVAVLGKGMPGPAPRALRVQWVFPADRALPKTIVLRLSIT